MFEKGMILGFLLCAPLGPIGILCLQRTLVSGRLAGAFSILGASVVDAFYTLVAALGVSLLAAGLEQSQVWLRPAAGLILAVVGTRLFFEMSPGSTPPEDRLKRLRDAFLTTFFLMLSNPLPILVISAALSALNGKLANAFNIFLLVSGVFVGSAVWAPIIVFFVSRIKPWLSGRHLRIFQMVCGAAIVVCGVVVGSAPLVDRLR
jgi:threonine/homoserine/homoserine lactone efflux protein